jgi:thiamine pyrophosphate-dependent acetolactate synthase large subunit-like protein
MMGLFNAWCDRVPMFVLGATGPVDASKRRPWVDWTHTAADQGGMVRDIVKFDNQPASPPALIEAMCRADMITRSLPMAPVYVCLDAGLQEAPLQAVPSWPELSRFCPPSPPHPSPTSIAQAADFLRAASRPLILFGRGSREIADWNARVALAERLGACVMTDLRTAAVFPTDHPAHVAAPMANAGAADRALLAEADVILSLEWCDLGGTVFPPTGASIPSAKIIAVSLDQMLHNGAHMNHQALAPADLAIAASADAVVHALLGALAPGTRPSWSASRVRAARRSLSLSAPA